MNSVLPVLLKDGYKVGHKFQYPEGTELVYSNFTPRASRMEGVDEVVFFGLQYFIKNYLIDSFNQNFFNLPKDEVVAEYKRRIDNYLGPDAVPVEHIAALHDLGYLPLEIRAVPEGTSVPLRVPMMTIHNTHPEFFWLTNMLETILSATLWMPCTSATIAREYLKVFREFANLTVGEDEDQSFLLWQGHDFSFRGMAGLEAAMLSGAGHLLSFAGTDTIPAIDFLEQYYNANSDAELIGGSVAATEHSVMCMGGEESEDDTFLRLLTQVYPTGILSVVSDTWDFWKVMTEILPQHRETILLRDGKLVVRPDSGDPVKIVCGDPDAPEGSPEYKGAVELLWETFGGTVTATGYKMLDPHVGVIYGDSINLDRQRRILRGLAAKGFASFNVVLGIGSFTYQYNTRDTFGFAVKATYGVVNGEERYIFKDPKTDDGTKKSARGPVIVVLDGSDKLALRDEVSWELSGNAGMLDTVFLDGKLVRDDSLESIRRRVQG